MEKGKTKFLVPLVALCVLLIGASPAFAQTDAVTYQITSTPTFVINTGRAEVLGAVRITAQIATAAPIATTAEFLHENIGCDNDLTNGVGLSFKGTAAAAAVISSVTNTAAGCVVAVTIPGALDVAVGDYIQVEGVRGRVDLSPAGAPSIGVDLSARLNATPSGSALFTTPSIVRVATSAVGLTTATITNGVVLFCTGPPPAPLPLITLQEGFNGAFVQHVVSLLGTALTNPRPATGVSATQGGSKNNTQVMIQVADIPAGVTLAFPSTTSGTHPIVGTNLSTGAASAGQLELLSSTVVGTTQTVVYEFATADQSISDINTEVFIITPVVGLPATLALGVATAQVRLWPDLVVGDATSVTTVPFGTAATPADPAAPRFNDPLIPTPPANFVTINPCSTNLLFPYLANVAGFDSGLAIANTSRDALAFPGLVPSTIEQAGTCTLHGWAAADATYSAFTTPSIAAGTTFLTVLSSASNPAYNGFFGYIIAVCNFQYAHGFAFLSDGFGQPPSQAQGYLALIIPDPFVTAGRGAVTAGHTPQEGEGLGQ